MRMWMCHPVILCRKHLVAEYNECKMFVGTLNKEKSIQGYIDNDLFEPLSLVQRHNALAREMAARGYQHNIIIEDFQLNYHYLTKKQINHKIDRKNSLKLLLMRCQECLKRFKQYKDYISPLDSFGSRHTCNNCRTPLEFDLNVNQPFELSCSNCGRKFNIYPYKGFYVYQS